MDDLFDAPDIHKFINIQFFFVQIFLFVVDVDTVLCRSCDHNGLFIVHLEELGLFCEWSLECVDLLDCIRAPIKFHDAGCFYEEHGCGLAAVTLRKLKVELHADLVEFGHIFDHNPLDLLKLILLSICFNNVLLFTFENEQLVCFLLFHNQILATDARDIVTIKRFSDGDDLVWLSCFCCKKRDWQLADSSECF